MKRIALIYNIIIISTFFGASLMAAKNLTHVTFSLLFIPPLIYFLRLLTASLHPNPFIKSSSQQGEVDSNSTLAVIQNSQGSTDITPTTEVVEAELLDNPEVGDINRRLFLKLIGGAGVSVFMMSIFTNKAHASFFGSMPVPGAMTVKDSAGLAIDPAEKQPTDGYEISEIDDASSPAYYGFVHKTGAWYISREETNGSYRYAKGGSDFPGGWALRATLVYDYFDNTF